MITLPITLDPYIYAINNPVRYVDPAGLSPQGGIHIPASIYSYLSICTIGESICNVKVAIIGTGLIIVGGVVIYAGYTAVKASLLTGQFELAGIAGLGTGIVGVLFVVGGFAAWKKSECLQVFIK